MITDPLSSPEYVSLYFHIPFCTKKCHYCHFFVLPDKAIFHRQLIDSIKRDLDRWKLSLQGKKLVSLYFGGGTPSLLTPEELAELISAVSHYLPFDPNKIEITLEANPDNISKEKMKAFASIGVNRVSIGVQTLDDQLLAKLGRLHAAQQAIDAIKTVADAGIGNLSIDLMYDIPYQTVSSWENTLEKLDRLPFTHLSLYNLTIEPHTVFFKYRESLEKQVPDEDTSTAMYQSAVKCLAQAGLSQYEISAFCKPGYYSRHNVGYWTGRPFLGFGPSAFSYWEGKRFRAVANLNSYSRSLEEGKDPADFSEILSPRDSRRELLTIALRLRGGVDLIHFEKDHGMLDPEVKLTIGKLVEDRLLTQSNGRVCLTDRGVLFYDSVAVALI